MFISKNPQIFIGIHIIKGLMFHLPFDKPSHWPVLCIIYRVQNHLVFVCSVYLLLDVSLIYSYYNHFISMITNVVATD